MKASGETLPEEGRRGKMAGFVGLPDQVTKRDAIAIQVLLNACGQDGIGCGAALLGESPREQTAVNISSGGTICGRSAPWWRTGVRWV